MSRMAAAVDRTYRAMSGDADALAGRLDPTTVSGPMSTYLIADIEVTDTEAYEEYRRHVPAIVAAHGGRYLVRGGATEVLEGTWHPRRTILLEFPSIAALRAFWDSPEYRPLRAIRERAARSNLVAVQGVDG